MHDDLKKLGLLSIICLTLIFAFSLCKGTPSVYAIGEEWFLCGNTPLNKNIACDAQNPSVAMLGDNIYVAWDEYQENTSLRQIRVKMFNGSAWSFIDGGGITGLNCNTGQDAQRPNLAAYNGELYLVWEEYNATTGCSLIHARKYSGSGSIWNDIDDQEGTNVIPLTKIVPCLNYITAGWAYTPVLTVYKGKMYASWTETKNGNITQVHVSRYDGGNIWNPVGTIIVDKGDVNGLNYNANLNAYFPSLAADNDYLYVAWGEYFYNSSTDYGYQLRVKKYDGTNWTSADGGSPLSLFGDSPDLMVYKGELYLAWYQPTKFGAAVRQIMMMKFDKSSSTWAYINPDPTVGLNYDSTQNAGSPTMGQSSDNMYISWQERSVNLKRMQLRVAAFNGTTRTFIDGNGDTGINNNTGNNAYHAAMVCNDKFLYNVWQEYTSYDTSADKKYQIYVKRLPLPYTVTASTASATPSVGADNAITLTVLNSLGVADTSFNGAKNVTISGCEAAPNGSYGRFNGIPLTGSSQTIRVDFTNGVASPNLVLYKAALQTIKFSVEGVATPAANSLAITPKNSPYTLTFSVTNGTNVIAGAQISISGQNITTDENGQASIALEDGDYTYSVTAAGYADVTAGSVTINGAGANKAITMMPNDKVDECFIATAAFGSKFTWPVVLLRHFRDQYLMTNTMGTAFVKFYYKNSPPIAAIITDSQSLKLMVRILLAPVIAIVYIMYHPILMGTVLVTIIMFFAYCVRQRRRVRQV